METFEKTFDRAAADYDRLRPAYATEIFESIFAYRPVGPESAVLEIGVGTGKASAPFLARGCRFVGIEPGENLISLAEERLRGYPNATLLTTTLQDYACADGTFDLIFAAASFHWIPEEYGYKRVYGLLKPGGAFARFAYHAGPDPKRPALNAEIQALYRAYMRPEKEYAPFGEPAAEKLAQRALLYGFTDVRFRLFHAPKDFTADEYEALLTTYPDHMRLPETARENLFGGICRAIRRAGGILTVDYIMDLELARKEP